MKTPILTIAMSVGLIGLYTAFGAAPDWLLWQSNSGNGETRLWQWLSTHFIHINGEHLTWNLAAFIILGSIIEQHSKRRLLLATLIGVLSVDIYLAWFYTLPAYAGLSGALNTLLVIGLYELQRIPKYKLAAQISFIASVLKLAYEWLGQTSVFSTLDWPSVPQAHFAGLIGGILLCTVLLALSKPIINTD